MSNGMGVVSAVANSITALAAAVTAGAAIYGLRTWKTQSEWHADNDLAKRALMTVYKYRDSVYSIRHPARFSAESEVTEEEVASFGARDLRSAGIIKAYANRFERHFPSRNALDAIILECDAVWGTDLRDLVGELKKLEQELFAYINVYFDAHHRAHDDDLAEGYRDVLKGQRDILYDRLDDEKDAFRVDFIKKLTEVEVYLRKKMGRKV